MFAPRSLLGVFLVAAVAPHAAAFLPASTPLLRSPESAASAACTRGSSVVSGFSLRMAEPAGAVSRRRVLDILAAGSIGVSVWVGGAGSASARAKKAETPEDAALPKMSLDEFYTALDAETVESVEFDGAEYEVRLLQRRVSETH
jgi:hypothetical protein